MTPSQRTTSWLKEQGYLIGTVERFIHPGSFRGAGYKVDLFGVIDQIAIRPGEILAVQTCGTDWSPHWKKIFHGTSREGAIAWIETGSPLLLLGWRKLKSGWTPRVHYFLREDFDVFGTPDRERSRQEWESATVTQAPLVEGPEK